MTMTTADGFVVAMMTVGDSDAAMMMTAYDYVSLKVNAAGCRASMIDADFGGARTTAFGCDGPAMVTAAFRRDAMRTTAYDFGGGEMMIVDGFYAEMMIVDGFYAEMMTAFGYAAEVRMTVS